MSKKGMKVMLSKDKLPGLKSIELDFYEDCIYGKQRRVSFSKVRKTLKTERLELIHTDVRDKASVFSLGGSLYFVTFIDDSSRKVWIYFLKDKSDVFDVFKKWLAQVENESGQKLKCLKSDNRGEYYDVKFEEFYASRGIYRVKTVPENPHQNGVVECINKTIMERARSMRIHSGLPKQLWADAVNTSEYLINRGTSVALNCEIPEEAWTEKE